MIPYEELVQALDRYVARNGGTPQSARAPASAHPVSAPVYDEPPAQDVGIDVFDEPHDPDLHGHGGGDDATHVGASPGGAALPPPLSPVAEDPSNEIDIGDVLSDDDL